MYGEGRNIASKWLAFGIAILLLATVVVLGVEGMRKPKRSVPRIIIGTRDEVYYSRAATMQDAIALAHALQHTGFFSDRGTRFLDRRS